MINQSRGTCTDLIQSLGDNAIVKPSFTFKVSGYSSFSSSRPCAPFHFNSASDSDCNETENGCSSKNDPQKKELKRTGTHSYIYSHRHPEGLSF